MVEPNRFGEICGKKKLLSDPYVLLLVTAAMFFNRSKISIAILCMIPQETFLRSLGPTDQVVSEEKSFEQLSTMTGAK